MKKRICRKLVEDISAASASVVLNSFPDLVALPRAEAFKRLEDYFRTAFTAFFHGLDNWAQTPRNKKTGEAWLSQTKNNPSQCKKPHQGWLSVGSVYALCAAKKLRHQRVGIGRGKIVIPSDAIDEYLARGTVKSTEAHPAALLSAARR